jgi:hypothetical protein
LKVAGLFFSKKKCPIRFAALRFGQEGWKSIRKLLLGGFLQGYVWAW